MLCATSALLAVLDVQPLQLAALHSDWLVDSANDGCRGGRGRGGLPGMGGMGRGGRGGNRGGMLGGRGGSRYGDRSDRYGTTGLTSNVSSLPDRFQRSGTFRQQQNPNMQSIGQFTSGRMDYRRK